MFDWIVGVIADLGYVGVALLTFLENLFPPIPSELIIPLAGFVAAQGTLHIGGVIAAGTLGSLAGATLWYAVARRIGERRFRAWIDRHGRWLTLGREDIDRAQAWFHRHGRSAVLIGRLVPGVRTFVSLPAGFSGMPAAPFLLWSALGTAVWTAVLAAAGLILDANYTAVADYLDIVADVLLGLFVALMVRRYLRCWNAAARSGVPRPSR